MRVVKDWGWVFPQRIPFLVSARTCERGSLAQVSGLSGTPADGSGAAFAQTAGALVLMQRLHSAPE